MSVQINGTNGLTFNDGSTQNTSPYTGGLAFRNRIINGAMVIDQRNAGASVSTQNAFVTDRWQAIAGAASKYTTQQNAGSVTPPAGFVNYLGVTSSSAYTVGSSEIFSLQQQIEGLNIADLAWGTANASPVTVSFWVRSSLTGTFGGAFQNSANDRSYPYTYTISTANTWEQKSITIPGDTSGTWLTTNGTGIKFKFGLGVGSTYSGTAGAWAAANYHSATGATSVVGTNGATFYITGVQLEKGSTATSFDYRPYGTELALCQRYYWVICKGDNQTIANGCAFTASEADGVIQYPVQMRANPSLDQTTGSAYYNFRAGGGGATFNSFSSIDASTINIRIYGAVSTTANAGGYFKTNAAGCYVALSSEL